MELPNEFSASATLNTFANSQAPQINLARRPFETEFWVDMESFFEFSFDISEELLDLEARHKSQFGTRKRLKDASASIEILLREE